MTNLEVLQGSAALNYPIEEGTYKAALIKNNVNPDEDYTSVNEQGVELAISDLALTLIFSAKKLMDDGYSIELQSISDLWLIRRWYRLKWGLPDDTPSTNPVLRDVSSKW